MKQSETEVPQAAAGSVALIGVASGRGAPDARCAEGPRALQAHGLAQWLGEAGQPAHWQAMIEASGEPVSALDEVADVADRLAAEVCACRQAGERFAVLGGDHSCAIGTWSGVARAAAQPAATGLIWIDAHMDAHTPETTPSNAIHGMPLACLLGKGAAALTHLAGAAPVLVPQQVCLLGVRSYEPGEHQLLTQLGLRVYTMDEIHRRGLATVFDEAVTHVRRHGAAWGLTLDLDAIDPQDAPGVGSPVAGGLAGAELVDVLTRCRRYGGLLGVEIAEFNPALDQDGRTAQLTAALLAAALGA